MEKEIRIKTKDGKYTYGKLRGSLKKPLVVFVHGLTGHMDEHIFFNGARFFEKKGFSTFRFNLYDDLDNTRKLHDCDLKVHSSDLNRVAAYLKGKGAKKIFAVGHSYGAPTIMFSQTGNYQAIVLWDPNMDPGKIYRKTEYNKELGMYIKEWSFKFALGKNMIAELKNISSYEDVAKKNKTPVKIILAEFGNAQDKKRDEFFKVLNQPKKRIIFKKTGHTFDEDGAEEKLFAETLKWLKKYQSK
jgi:dienelactone hydrolase